MELFFSFISGFIGGAVYKALTRNKKTTVYLDTNQIAKNVMSNIAKENTVLRNRWNN